MNYKMIARMLGRVILIIGVSLLIPLFISIGGRDGIYLSFLIPSLSMLAIGVGMNFIKPKDNQMSIAAGFAIVALSWIALSLFGSLPFLISGGITEYMDCLFESVSGFTTTGATILQDVEALPRSLLFWRSFTHWIGGLGVLLFVIAILPKTGSGAMHIFRAEATGPQIGKLVSKLKVTARILYLIHIAFTMFETIALLICGLSFFDAINTALSTAGTGGFSVRNASIAAYDSLAVEMVVLVFMFLFSINYNLFFLILIGKAKQVFKSEEFRAYIVLLTVAILSMAINIISVYGSFWTALRYASFQALIASSTTGFMSADYTAWPAFSQGIMLLLMIIGSTAGSTGGGFKVSRFLILTKSFFKNSNSILRPRSVKTLKFDGKPLDAQVLDSVNGFFAAYIALIIGGTLLISINGYDFATNFSAAISCLSNVGPGLSQIGPTQNFSDFSIFSKLVMCFLMLAGRLEIFPILFIFYPRTWLKK
ncbi:MAG: TrkH family potassium uptake protein [Clostridiaceae bacterium]|jgi:trk system potassium uptake protein TrkH|nr:TrkH family potassium uptake protein [Clostridiaceae bacterium]